MVKSNRVMPLKFWRKKQFSMYNHSINPVGGTNHDIFITGKQSENVYSPIFSQIITLECSIANQEHKLRESMIWDTEKSGNNLRKQQREISQ